MIYQRNYSSPFGMICMQSDGEYLTGLWFEKSKDEKKHAIKDMEKDLPIFEETKRWLDVYFEGQVPNFIPKYKIEHLTPFRKQVIDCMLQIPYGDVITYKAIADKIAQQNGIEKMSAQAVGGAVGWNPICIIIPCHRVVGADGNLTGYGGGIENKIKLLELEQHDMKKFKLPTKRSKI